MEESDSTPSPLRVDPVSLSTWPSGREVSLKANLSNGEHTAEVANTDQVVFLFVLWGIFVPLIAGVGLVGNALTIMVLWRKEMHSTTILYLRALVITDTGILIFVVITLTPVSCADYLYGSSMNYFRHVIYPQLYTPGYYLVMTLQQCNVWITVAVSVERYISICHPFKAARLISRRKTLAVIGSIVLISCLYNLPHVFAYSVIPCNTKTATGGPASGSSDGGSSSSNSSSSSSSCNGSSGSSNDSSGIGGGSSLLDGDFIDRTTATPSLPLTSVTLPFNKKEDNLHKNGDIYNDNAISTSPHIFKAVSTSIDNSTQIVTSSSYSSSRSSNLISKLLTNKKNNNIDNNNNNNNNNNDNDNNNNYANNNGDNDIETKYSSKVQNTALSMISYIQRVVASVSNVTRIPSIKHSSNRNSLVDSTPHQIHHVASSTDNPVIFFNSSSPDCYQANLTDFGLSCIYHTLFRTILYSLIIFVIPFLMLIILNSCLIRELMTMQRRRAGTNITDENEANLSLVLVLIVIVFLFCQTPGLISQFEIISEVQHYKYIVVSNVLFVTNSAVNFLIYTAFGRRFRTVLLRIFRRLNRQRTRKMHTSFQATQYSSNNDYDHLEMSAVDNSGDSKNVTFGLSEANTIEDKLLQQQQQQQQQEQQEEQQQQQHQQHKQEQQQEQQKQLLQRRIQTQQERNEYMLGSNGTHCAKETVPLTDKTEVQISPPDYEGVNDSEENDAKRTE